jgi:hypothetical protein
MKRKVLIIYYSQCGQTKKAIDGLSAELAKSYEITNIEISPKHPYEFPWKITNFFRAFPRCVNEDYPEINPLDPEVLSKEYDLVVIGYQVWFLSPSLPILSLMNNKSFIEVINGKDVIGIITSRNMWISAVSIINNKLKALGSKKIRNLVLCDTGPAWATFITTPRWMLTGKKEAFSFFPEAGVSEKEFQRASRFASLIASNGIDDEVIDCSHHQTNANLVMEKIGRMVFKRWASLIDRLTNSDGLFRDFLLMLFRINLVVLILTLVPLISFFMIIRGEKPSTLVRNLLIPN